MMHRTRFYSTWAVALLAGMCSVAALASGTSAKLQEEISRISASRASQSRVEGQSQTLLSDGRILFLGGREGEKVLSTAYITNPEDGKTTKLIAELRFARFAHTATVLPNGTVLIFGGIGGDGALVTTSEMFDPSNLTFTAVSTNGVTLRAFHTATLLTDGRVLVAGGMSASGQVTGRLEYWDYRTGKSTLVAATLKTPRGAHTAVLQANGSVLFWNGVDAKGNLVASGEIFDPETGDIQSRADLPPPSEFPVLAASSPIDGAQNVELNPTIALRFSKPLDVRTLNDKNISLSGPSGKNSERVIAAEGGRLAFITSKSTLLPATQYEMSILGALDPSGTALPDTVLRFSTVGADSSVPATIGPLPVPQKDPFDSPSRKLPPLQARKGVTAISGQVLQLSGDPLPNTTLQIGDIAVRSDKTGRFLLENIPAGHQSMWIDGTTAGHNGVTYGIYEDGVDVAAGKTTVLKYTIWMTALDTVDEVTIASPTDRETIISTPVMPGLELHIPAGTVIKDRNDKTVTKVGITLIPVNQPPFPLPAGVNVPTYFTIQPGGAYLEGWGVNNSSVGARLFYPNAEKLPPNTLFDFWNYDADAKGWFIYGQGHVTADAKQVVPNPGVEIYEFSGAMVGNPPTPPNGPTCSDGGDNCNGGDPVDLQTGLFVYTKTDLALSDVIPIELTRTYRQLDPTSHAFGIGTMSNYDTYLIGDGGSWSTISLVLASGGQIRFDRISAGTSWGDAVLEATSTPGPFYGAQIYWNGNGWTLTMRNGTRMLFPESSGASTYLQAALIGVIDRYGNTLTLTRDSNHNLTRVSSPNGRWIQYTYDAYNRVIQANDSTGRNVYYTYDSGGRLYTVKDANAGTTTFSYYSTTGLMASIQDARGISYITNVYDVNGMIAQQTMADGGVYKFSYITYPNQNAGIAAPGYTNSQATVTDPRGNVRVVTFNADGYMTSEINAKGKPEQQTITYTRQPVSGFLLSKVDALNRLTAFSYDSMGDVTTVTSLAGTPNATTTSFAYNRFGEVTSVTDALGRTKNFNYDSNGNLQSFTGTDGNTLTMTYSATGQPISFTDPLGNTTQLSYSNADISGVTDPDGRQISRFTDAAGRLGSLSDSQGKAVQANFNSLNQVTTTTNAQGDISTLSYDANGNLSNFVDSRDTQGPTKFFYEQMDRLQTRTDALNNSESYAYDLNGNLTQFTDRRGKITNYQYDALNRLTFVGFGTQPGPTYESTIGYTWDAGNRISQVTDSLAGTTVLAYDNLDRVTSVSSPQGSVSYTYDALGRRQTMAVAGQTTVTYSYDTGDRITQIAQGGSVVQIGYDADGRRTSVTLPNGIVSSYSYDAASQHTGITYTRAGAILGDLTYTYDSSGRHATVGGSLAQTNLPQPISGLAYNAANQLTQFGTAQLSYDANGNLIRDGAHTYTWDARNHLVAIDGGSTASFVYDAFGRRVSKTVYGITTGFLYDGANVVQELSGTSPSANLLTGEPNEVFARADNSGLFSFLRDSYGSTLALTDSAGAYQQSYVYDPYGNTSTGGNSSSSSYKYLGRETDATGLYYLHDRYYNPITQTFISEDPIRLAGGPNLYQYGADNPTTYIDPNGNQLLLGCAMGALGYELGQIGRGLSGRKMDSGWNEFRGAAQGCFLGFLGAGAAEVVVGAFGMMAAELGPALMDSEGLAAQVANAQRAAGYNADEWLNTTLGPGRYVVQGSPGEGNFFTSLEQFESSGQSLEDYNEGLQINPNPNYAPRQGVTVYQVQSPTSTAVSDALANGSYGQGGWTQYYIPEQSGLCAVYCIPFLP